MIKSIPGTSPTWAILKALIWLFLVTQVVDFATMWVMGLQYESNPLAHWLGIPVFGVAKLLGDLFGVWLALKMPDVYAASALGIGIAIGAIGVGTNLTVIVGLWEAGLL